VKKCHQCVQLFDSLIGSALIHFGLRLQIMGGRLFITHGWVTRIFVAITNCGFMQQPATKTYSLTFGPRYKVAACLGVGLRRHWADGHIWLNGKDG
jgi:hypothetical protein